MLLLSPFHQAHKKHQQKQQRPNLSTPAKNRLLFCADTSTTADTLPFPSPQQPPPSSASSASVASADVSSSKATSWNNQATLVATTAALNEFLLVIMMTMVSTTQDDYNNNNNTVLSSKYTLTFTTTAITDYFVLSSSSLSWYKRNIPDDKRLRKKLVRTRTGDLRVICDVCLCVHAIYFSISWKSFFLEKSSQFQIIVVPNPTN